MKIGIKRKVSIGILGLLLLLIIIPLTTAAIGCCFEPNTGVCRQNALDANCTDPGEFYQSPSCSISKCEKGCCILGTSVQFVTDRTCELLSRSFGFSYPDNFQYTDKESCDDLARAQDFGACIYEREYEDDCKFIAYSDCPTGNFHSGALCSDPELDTICEKTTKTFCDDDDVYYKDSCGNRDELKEDCDYESGSVCRERGLTAAYCQDLNCAGGKQNGEKWCIIDDLNAVGKSVSAELENQLGKSSTPVGTRFGRQYCLNGVIYTEACQDFKAETCEDGECVLNSWETCFVDDIEDCDEEYCEVYSLAIRSTRGDYKPNSAVIPDFNICVPKKAGGLDFFTKTVSSGTTTTEADTVCANGDFSIGSTDGDDKIILSRRAGQTSQCTQKDGGNVTLCGLVADEDRWEETSEEIALNVRFVQALEKRCAVIGDCGGKYNFNLNLGRYTNFDSASESSETEGTKYASATLVNRLDSDAILSMIHSNREGSTQGNKYFFWLSMNFSCEPFEEPSGSANCDACNQGVLPCSEYKCASLGSRCENSEPSGADKGHCVSSDDHNPASITLINMTPSSPIPPFTPVAITLSTSEEAFCKFNIGDSGGTYDDMQYDFSEVWGTEHKVILNLPGQILEEEEENVTDYELITKDGKYEMFVRCQDTAENANIAAFLVSFEVMQTPDDIPPIIYENTFTPISGSAIKYNTTSKQISFQVNEPVECKWSLADISYESMENELSCDEEITDQGALNGYWCTDVFDKVTNDPLQKTKYYIRCKDQPWLEGKETDLYKRNTNIKSVEYSLTASKPFEILNIAPIGDVIMSSMDRTVKIEVVTVGGGYKGVSECKWKIGGGCLGDKNTVYSLFEETNSKIHKQITTSLGEGHCKLDVRCEDESGNFVNGSSEFRVKVDDKAPSITRTYHFAGLLKVFTDEDAECRYVDDSRRCSFEWDDTNVSVMDGRAKEHTTTWTVGKSYYIRCKDYNENINRGCGVIIKTY